MQSFSYLRSYYIDSPAVRTVLQTHSFDIDTIAQGSVDFFLCIPPEHLETQFRLIRLFISLVFNVFKQARGDRTVEPLLMIIDEMPALEYIPEIENMLVYGRGYGVTLMGFSQTLELIQSLYPKTWRTFMSSAITIFFDTCELTTAEYVSKKLGQTTLRQESSNKGKSWRTIWGAMPSIQESITVSEVSKPLLTPDEVATLGEEISIIFMKGNRPMLLKKPCYYKDKRWKGRFDENRLEKRLFNTNNFKVIS